MPALLDFRLSQSELIEKPAELSCLRMVYVRPQLHIKQRFSLLPLSPNR